MRPPAALSVMIKLSPWDLLQVLSLWFQWKTSYRCVCITTRDIWRLITRLSAKIHWHIFKDLTCIQSHALKKVEAKKKSQNTVLSRIKVQSLFNSWTRKHSLTFLTGALRKRCALHLISFDKIPDLLFSLCLPQKKMCVNQETHFLKPLGSSPGTAAVPCSSVYIKRQSWAFRQGNSFADAEPSHAAWIIFLCKEDVHTA